MQPEGSCPADPEDVAEAFVLRRLGEKAAEDFRQHILTCRRCEERLSQARAFIAGIKAAHESGEVE